MKKTLLSLSLVIAMFAANAQVLLYDGFEYTIGDTLPQHSWLGVNSGDQIFVTNGSLNYSGFASSLGNKISFDSTGRDFQKTFTATTSGTVYVSFLMQVTNLASLDAVNGGYFTGVAGSTSLFGSTVWTRKNGAGFNLGLSARTTVANNVWDNTVLTLNSVVLVVVSYELVAGTTNDIVKMWINPSSASFGGTTEPTPTITITNIGTDLTSIDRIFVRQDSQTETPYIDADEIRVGTTWASVTPAVTGINENVSDNKISVYPNPATNFVTINSKESISHINIFDFQGRIVQEYDFNGTTEIKLNVADLSKGIYSIVANCINGNSFSTKLIK